MPDVIINTSSGQVSVNFEGHSAASLIMLSEAGIFSGADDPAWGSGVNTAFAVDNDNEVSNTILGSPVLLSGTVDLGRIIGGEWLAQLSEADLLDDLEIKLLDAGNIPAGQIAGNVIFVPEPSTLCLVAIALLGLVGLRRRLAA